MSFLFNVNDSKHHQHSNSTDSIDTLSGTSNNDLGSTGNSNSTSSFLLKRSQQHQSRSDQNKANIETVTFSFAAAGWLQVYLFGTAHALIENVPGVRVQGLHDSYHEYIKNLKSNQNNNDDSVDGTPILPTPKHSNSTECDDATEEPVVQQQDIPSRSPSVSHIDGIEKNTENNNTNNNTAEQQRTFPKFKFVGSSAGSLASAAILLGTDMPEMLEYAVECVNYARSKWTRAFELRKFVEDGVARFAINVFQRDKSSAASSSYASTTAPSVERDNILVGDDTNTDDEDDFEYYYESDDNDSVRDGETDNDTTSTSSKKKLRKRRKRRTLIADPLVTSSPSTTSLLNNSNENVAANLESTNVGFFTLVEERTNNDEDVQGVDTDAESAGAKSPRATSPSTLKPTTTIEEQQNVKNKKSSSSKKKSKKPFPGDEGGWLGNEFFFPKHIRDQLRERLEVYATSLPWIKEVCFSEFESTIDLEEALVASCLLTPLAGLPFKLRRTGDWVCDGGLRSFQPRKGQPGVITISAMYFNAADIVPSVFVPAWWGLYPPPEEQYRQLFALGYNDMLVWLWKNGILEKPQTSEERKEKLMKYDSGKMPQKHGFFGYILDFFAAVFFLGVLRPFAMVAIYAELWFVSTICFFATVFHEIFPRTFDFLIGTKSLRNRKAGGRMETAKDFWAVIKNLTSPKTMLHLAIGYRNVNAKRLGKYSRLYRLFKPFVSSSSAENSKNKNEKQGNAEPKKEKEE